MREAGWPGAQRSRRSRPVAGAAGTGGERSRPGGRGGRGWSGGDLRPARRLSPGRLQPRRARRRRVVELAAGRELSRCNFPFPDIKNTFKVTAAMAVTANDKAKLIADFQRGNRDTGSPEVQIALLVRDA